MPLSDLFKKSPKKEPAQATQKEPVKTPMADNPLSSPEMQKKRYEAAMEFVKIFRERVPLVDRKPHAGTVLYVAARLAGSSLFRSLNGHKLLSTHTTAKFSDVLLTHSADGNALAIWPALVGAIEHIQAVVGTTGYAYRGAEPGP